MLANWRHQINKTIKMLSNTCLNSPFTITNKIYSISNHVKPKIKFHSSSLYNVKNLHIQKQHPQFLLNNIFKPPNDSLSFNAPLLKYPLHYHSMTCKVPQITSLDPTEIPSVGCCAIKNVQFQLDSTCSTDFSIANFTNCDTIVFACFRPDSSSNKSAFSMTPQMQEFDEAFAGSSFKKFLSSHNFTAKMGKSQVFNIANCERVNSIGVVGMGSLSEISPKHADQIAEKLANIIKSQKCKTMHVVFPDEMEDEDFFQAFMQSFYISISPHMLYVSNKKSKDVFKEFELCKFIMNKKFQDHFTSSKFYAQAIAEGTYVAAEMVNAPANYCNTISLANMAVKIAEEFSLDYKIMDTAEIEQFGMGAYLGVAKGSFFPPKFIHLTYKSNDYATKKIFFVGKGIVFDTGGYNLKSEGGMSNMKIDMGGAAAVLGAAKAIGQIKPTNLEVHFIVAAAENMISSKAYRPGDILTASNGKTIEIGNTDAEGRLALCDSLVYSEKMGADCIIDLATLTGACMAALGSKYAGLFSSDDMFAKQIKQCADKTGELVWQLPLASEYSENFSSKIADMNNIAKGGQGGGAIIAALFLKRFVDKPKWAHLDIAGPVFNSEKGVGTGFGVKTIVQYAINSAKGTM